MNNMEAGEKEMRKVFEDVTTGNVRTMIAYCKETRKLTHELGQQVQELKGMVATRDIEIIELRRQLGIVQGKVYQNGS